MSSAAPGSVLVMGAGSIGCFLGGSLAAVGVPVTLVGRPRVLSALRAHGLSLSDLDGANRHVPAAALTLADSVPADARPTLVLLTVKSGATASAAAELGAVLPAGTLVVSMQNGLSNAAQAQRAAPGLRVLPGMVPYNVAEIGPGKFHRGTDGVLAAQDDPALRGWTDVFARSGLGLKLYADLKPVQWGKLLLNLNNAVNALSGQPLRDELLDRGYRRCLAALMDEALIVLARAGIAPAKVAAVAPRFLPALLRLPTPLFRLIAARMLRIDAKARSSMADDLSLGRPTEIDALCGEVVRLATAHEVSAPRNSRMIELVQAYSPQLPAMTSTQMLDALTIE
jgi:2-dehydropantoate 2-reductase